MARNQCEYGHTVTAPQDNGIERCENDAPVRVNFVGIAPKEVDLCRHHSHLLIMEEGMEYTDLQGVPLEGTMAKGIFNQAVVDHLEEIGKEEVARRSEEMDRGMSSLPSWEVARDLGLPLTQESVKTVAEKRVEWVEEVEQEAL